MNSIKQTIKERMPKGLYDLCHIIRANMQIANGYHMIKKNRVKKTQKDEKLRIVFIVQRTEVFNSVRTIFELAVASDRCEVYLLPIPRCDTKQKGLRIDTYATVVEFCRQLHAGVVIDTYNAETEMYFDLAQIMPDYIFLNVPYTDLYPETYSIEKLTSIAKVCYVPYGYALSNSNRYGNLYSLGLSNKLLQNVDFLFADSRSTYTYCRRKMWLRNLLYGNSLFELGFPRFDSIKVDSARHMTKNILWLPRWTSEKQSNTYNLPSHFFMYKDLLPQYAEERQDGYLVVRPHPLAFQNYIEKGSMTVQEVQTYKNRIIASPWVRLDEKPSYDEALDQADVLVTDYSSIIIEYVYRGKPVIYCGEKEDLAPEASYLTDTFYYVNSWEQLHKTLNDLYIGIDPQREKRSIAVEKFRKSTKNAAKNILDVLRMDFECT